MMMATIHSAIITAEKPNMTFSPEPMLELITPKNRIMETPMYANGSRISIAKPLAILPAYI